RASTGNKNLKRANFILEEPPRQGPQPEWANARPPVTVGPFRSTSFVTKSRLQGPESKPNTVEPPCESRLSNRPLTQGLVTAGSQNRISPRPCFPSNRGAADSRGSKPAPPARRSGPLPGFRWIG